MDFVCFWDRHCQALFMVLALSYHVSMNKGATSNPASLDPMVGWSREQGMDLGAVDGAGSGEWSQKHEVAGHNSQRALQNLDSPSPSQGMLLEEPTHMHKSQPMLEK